MQTYVIMVPRNPNITDRQADGRRLSIAIYRVLCSIAR